MRRPEDDGVRGGSSYDDAVVLARYRDHRRAGIRSTNEVVEEHAVLEALGPVAGLRALDLGCGATVFGRDLLGAGALSYLGVDGSAAMVADAEAVLDGTAGCVVHADLEDLEVPQGSADLVVCRLVLPYVEDLAAVLLAVHRALAPAGRLVVTVVHPLLSSSDSSEPEQARGRWRWTTTSSPDPGDGAGSAARSPGATAPRVPALFRADSFNAPRPLAPRTLS